MELARTQEVERGLGCKMGMGRSFGSGEEVAAVDVVAEGVGPVGLEAKGVWLTKVHLVVVVVGV